MQRCVAQRNDRPAGAIRRTEFGLQVRLPYFVSQFTFRSHNQCQHPAAARKFAGVVENLALVLSIELTVAFQAMEFLRPLSSSPPIERARRAFRRAVRPWRADRELAPDLAAARTFLDGEAMSGAIADLA